MFFAVFHYQEEVSRFFVSPKKPPSGAVLGEMEM